MPFVDTQDVDMLSYVDIGKALRHARGHAGRDRIIGSRTFFVFVGSKVWSKVWMSHPGCSA